MELRYSVRDYEIGNVIEEELCMFVTFCAQTPRPILIKRGIDDLGLSKLVLFAVLLVGQGKF